jgi:hypothetical protein
MSSFLTELQIKPVDGKDMVWELLAPFRYWIDELHDGTVIEMPIGARTDFASIPRIFWNILPPWGKYGKAAVIHDWLYKTGVFDRKKCDVIFLEAMNVLGVNYITRYTMYYGVRAGGWYAWDKHRAEGSIPLKGMLSTKNERY